MGYEVHITRADDWADNEACPIAASEWLAVVDQDESLRLVGCNGPCFVIWTRHPTIRDAWLDWSSGNISTKAPDQFLLAKMREIAEQLGAKVQGDDGETYPLAAAEASRWSKCHTIWSKTSMIAFVLSLVTLGCILVAVPLDRSLRQHDPVGRPAPLIFALGIVGIIFTGVCGWMAGTVLAIASLFIDRSRSRQFAIAALGINAAIALFVLLMK